MTFCLLLLGGFGAISAGEAPEVVEATYPVNAAARSRFIFELPRGPYVLEQLELAVEGGSLSDWAGVLLRLTWDGASAPAVSVRIDDLFGLVAGVPAPGFAPVRGGPTKATLKLPMMAYSREAHLALTIPRPVAGQLRLRLVEDGLGSAKENGYMHIRSAQVGDPGDGDGRVQIGGEGRLLGLAIRPSGRPLGPDDSVDLRLDRIEVKREAEASPPGPRGSGTDLYSCWWLEAPPHFSRSLDLGLRSTRQGMAHVTLFYRSGREGPAPGAIEGP